jgi:lysophospholipase-2
MDPKNNIHIVAPLVEHSNTVIFLHGRDSIASEFASKFLEIQSSDHRTLSEIFPSVKWVFPSSSLRKSARRFGTEISQWFDIWSIKEPWMIKKIQLDGLRESITFILDVIRSEASIVPPERIIIGGISQGAATAILAMLCGGIRLGGFIGLCSWLPLKDDLRQVSRSLATRGYKLQQIRNLLRVPTEDSSIMPLTDLYPGAELAFATPIFLSHSEDDDVLPIENGMSSRYVLEELGLAVKFKVYEDGKHWINEPRGVDDIVSFLKRRSTT